MRSYRESYDGFSIADLERRVLQGSLANGLNACIECCDRWANGSSVAVEWFGAHGERESITFGTFQADAARFANLLTASGIGPGDVVAGLLPRIPELLTVLLGTWRVGAVYQPLFSAFGPKAIEDRVSGPQGSQAKLILADPANRLKLDDVADCPPMLLVDRNGGSATGFAALLAAQPEKFTPVMRRCSDPFILIFTSGTTGRAKGVAASLSALLQFAVFMEDGIDLQHSDVYWCFADPGWAFGMYCALTAPLLLGHATVLYEGAFAVESTVRIIAVAGVTNLVAAPTVFRLMRAAGEAALAPIAGQLRCITSGGEPLNPEITRWGASVLGKPIHNVYGQTEMGVNVCNHHGLRQTMATGSVGLPSPGFAFAVLDNELRPVPAGTTGVLAVDRENSPLFFFAGYWNAETPAFRGQWYLTGDTMRQDPGGNLYFVSRNDDIITSAGYRIGPADVESAIIEHPSVAEVAVVGKRDPERTEIVKAFIVLRAGYQPDQQLTAEIQLHVRTRLSLHAYPREIEFLDELPKTPSGKVQRFVLRQMDLPTVDTMAAVPP